MGSAVGQGTRVGYDDAVVYASDIDTLIARRTRIGSGDRKIPKRTLSHAG